MIKFAFFETDTSYQCHFSEIGGFVVSIAHYMRAYFNYQALLHGENFELPGDVGYLNVSGIYSAYMWHSRFHQASNQIDGLAVHSTAGDHVLG